MTGDNIGDYVSKHPVSARDLAFMFMGKKLGSGSTRDVFICQQDDTCVIKYEPRGSRFQNVLEWEIWNTVKDTKIAKYFAPCVDISSNGLFLIQKRCDRIPKSQYPKKIPEWFMDTKYNNFGVIGKQFVAFDYGTAHITGLNKLVASKKMKRAEWWTEA